MIDFLDSKSLNITDEFIKKAMGYSGMCGGNLKAPLWFCGIKFEGLDSHYASLPEPV